MISDNLKHKEAKITAEFINWFKTERKYIEFYEDVDTSGSDPFDSAGIIGTELYLIEFKNKISKSMVNYKNSKGSSIEKKIGQVLDQLYRKKNSNIYNSIKEHYTNSSIPNVIIVADTISETAKLLLSQLLEKRSKEWRFNYSVIEWKNDKANYLLNERPNTFKNSILNSSIEIPIFPSTAIKRNPKLNYKKVNQRLNLIDKFEIYKMFLEYASSIGANLTYNINCVNIKFKGKTLFGIWPFGSEKSKGLRMTFEVDKIRELINGNIKYFNYLGIERSKEKLGYLGFNGYVKNEIEMKNLIENLKNAC